MHIGAGHLNAHTSQSSVAASVLAARRADETRRKLSSASAELDALSTSESAWMIDAWAGGGQSRGQHGQHPQQEQGTEATQNQPASPTVLSPADASISLSAVQAGYESSAQIVSQIAAEGSRPLLVSSQMPAAGEEMRRTPATGPVSFWA